MDMSQPLMPQGVEHNSAALTDEQLRSCSNFIEEARKFIPAGAVQLEVGEDNDPVIKEV